jgi:hypothetical protein
MHWLIHFKARLAPNVDLDDSPAAEDLQHSDPRGMGHGWKKNISILSSLR